MNEPKLETKSMAKKPLKDAFKSFVFDGVVLALLGIVLLFWPDQTMNVIFMILGGVMAAVGLVKVIAFFSQKDAAKRNGVDLAIGIVQIAFGVTMIVAANFFRELFYLAVGLIVVYGCILMAVEMFRLRRRDPVRYWAALIFGVLLLALAAIIFFRPAALMHLAFRIHGVALLLVGLSLIFVMSKKEDR